MIMLGGAGVIAGAILGGLTLGFAEAIGYEAFPGSVTYLIIFIGLILFLIIRPAGDPGQARSADPCGGTPSLPSACAAARVFPGDSVRLSRLRPMCSACLTNAAIAAVVSSGVWLTFAIGRINIAQGAFCMIGGYVTAILTTRYGRVRSGCACRCPRWSRRRSAPLIGWPLLRLKGVYFSMISLSLTEAVRLAFLNGGRLTNEASGIVGIPGPSAVTVPASISSPRSTVRARCRSTISPRSCWPAPCCSCGGS